MTKRFVFIITVLLATTWIAPALQQLHAEDAYFNSNGVKIHFTDEGKGEPVLLIHGFTANIQIQWALPGVTRALLQEHRVIAFDNRGHGKSDRPRDAKQYGCEMVEDAVRLLDHLQIKKAHVVGYSMGAMIACKLLAAHPDRLLSVTLGGACGVREGADVSFFDLLASSLDEGKGIAPLLVTLTPPGHRPPTEQQLKSSTALLNLTHDTKALAALVRSWKTLTVKDQELKSNHIPVLCLIGADDPLKKNVDEVEQYLANLRVVVIDKADHMNAFAKPAFSKELLAFLEKVRAMMP